jgi:hypothetical protein
MKIMGIAPTYVIGQGMRRRGYKHGAELEQDQCRRLCMFRREAIEFINNIDEELVA